MLVSGYLLAPLFLIVPLMVSSVLAADALRLITRGPDRFTRDRIASS